MRNAPARLPLVPSGFVTVTVREEEVFWRFKSIVMFTMSLFELTNSTEFVEIPSPKLTTAPGWKFSPSTVTSSVSSGSPDVGGPERK